MLDEKHYHIGSDLNCHWNDGTVTKPESVSLGTYGESICMACELQKLSLEAVKILEKSMPKDGSWPICENCYREFEAKKDQLDKSV